MRRILLDNIDEDSNGERKKDLCSRIVDWCDNIVGNNFDVSKIYIFWLYEPTQPEGNRKQRVHNRGSIEFCVYVDFI